MAPPHNKKSQAPRLYLVTPPVGDAAAFSGELATALEAADIAAVLLRLAELGEREKINCIKALATVVQDLLSIGVYLAIAVPLAT